MMKKIFKGRLATVLRGKYEATGNGVSSKNDDFLVFGDTIKGEGFTEEDHEKVLKIVTRKLFGDKEYLTAYPIDENGKVLEGGMFGGNFIYSSCSSFSADYPIPIHDRFES